MILPTSFLPNTYYLSLVANNMVEAIGVSEIYRKQTLRNRAEFLGANGRFSFTIPVRKIGYPSPHTSEVLLSEHDNWRGKLWQLLMSAYSSTPYWEHYSLEVKEHIYNPAPKLVEYNHDWLTLIGRFVGIDIPPITYQHGDLLLGVVESNYIQNLPKPTRYWQVFESKYGFQPYLSSLDMLFNLGPESRLILCEDAPNASHGQVPFQVSGLNETL